ncbi:protein Hikeshi-like [Clytia hemisphaerica]|uniref:Hikeshi-like domain-containing protein n=1 Tax=Clytia hemisphaerica TaxID=252671 RepID=A0A7M5XAK2_9CNID|eukprot:TCONS_00025666-protein
MASPMFGCVIPGRMPLFDAQQVSENQVVFQLPQCNSINHVVLFMTGSQPIPQGFAAAVYLCWPKPQPAWYLLGFLGNEKPSVIFKIAKPKQGTEQANLSSGWQTNLSSDSDIAQIGIAIEPVSELTQKTPLENTQATSLSTFVQFTQKMASNLFNYCSSFAVTQSEMTPQPTETFIPLNTIQKWYQTFERRMSRDPNFWKDL